jgi:hypothetical protein
VTDDPRLTDVFAAARYVLLDFDGPVCDVFAGTPAHDVAENLRAHLSARYAEPLPDDILATDDPLLIVRRVADFAPHLMHDIDAARASNVRVIGYVNKPGKDDALREADALTTRMSELAYLAGQPPIAAETVNRTSSGQ